MSSTGKNAPYGGGNLHMPRRLVSNNSRRERNGHDSGVLWLTGLSGSGKSTIAARTEEILFRRGWQAVVLDGDAMRQGLCSDLDFTPQGRRENIRRTAETARLFSEAGIIAIVALISPYRRERAAARAICGDRFHEIHIRADLSVCEKRDPKGLYLRARKGEIRDFTGIDAPYEAPETPELVIDTTQPTAKESIEKLIRYIDGVFNGKTAQHEQSRGGA